jgi:hypothetical protein
VAQEAVSPNLQSPAEIALVREIGRHPDTSSISDGWCKCLPQKHFYIISTKSR